jgi:hypothetical protein
MRLTRAANVAEKLQCQAAGGESGGASLHRRQGVGAGRRLERAIEAVGKSHDYGSNAGVDGAVAVALIALAEGARERAKVPQPAPSAQKA